MELTFNALLNGVVFRVTFGNDFQGHGSSRGLYATAELLISTEF